MPALSVHYYQALSRPGKATADIARHALYSEEQQNSNSQLGKYNNPYDAISSASR
jgi:hypothetical protein